MIEESIKTILSYYEIGSLISKHVYTSGTVQENIQLHTDKGIYVLKHYKSRSIEYVKFELSLIEHLNKNSFCSPMLFKTKSGELFSLFKNKVVVIYECIEGEHKDVLKYDHLDQLIRKVAELHLNTENLQLKGYKHRWNYGQEFCKKYIRTHLKDKNNLASEQKKQWLINELNNLTLPDKLSKGIIHGDLDTSNIIFEKQVIKAIIDFDDSNYTYLVFDIIGLIDRRNYKFLSNKYFELISYIINKYGEVRSLNDTDIVYLFDVLKLSIIIDCFWFFDRGNFEDFIEKNKIDQLNKLGRELFSEKLNIERNA